MHIVNSTRRTKAMPSQEAQQPTQVTSLPPRVLANCQVLVLGSLPGVASLQASNYYAHPRNLFWPVMGSLLGVNWTSDLEQRVQSLLHHRIGLWDVIGRCERRGSLDTAIVKKSIQPNPVADLVATLTQLRVIACNGQAAYHAWQRYIEPKLVRIPLVYLLPSTSPANASWSLTALTRAWAVAIHAGQSALCPEVIESQ